MLLATVICDCKSNDDDDDDYNDKNDDDDDDDDDRDDDSDDGGGGCDHCGVGCLEKSWIPELTQYSVQ